MVKVYMLSIGVRWLWSANHFSYIAIASSKKQEDLESSPSLINISPLLL